MIRLYENFVDNTELKNMIFIKAVNTDKTDIVDFFLKKGYDINTEEALITATYDDNMFRFFLQKGANLDVLKNETRLEELSVQKALIDFDQEFFIYSNSKFNYKLKNDPKYADIIDRLENMDKYNI